MIRFFFALLASYYVSVSASDRWFYSIVIDAGSKGSRVILFKWQPENSLPRKSIQIPVQVAAKAVNPGLAAFALTPTSVKDPLKEMIDFAVDVLEPLSSVYEYIPVYLKATAGLRDLIPTARDAIMRETISFISAYSPFYFKPDQALVISGEEEGAFGWLTVNALKGVLGKDSGESTYGIIDLGGASMQVSFVPETNHYVLQNCYPLTLTDQSTYRLYAKSYLHYGIVEANRRLTANIITENILKVDSVDVISNPCFYSGMEVTPDFATDKYKIPISVKMTGSGDFTKCVDELKQLFEKDHVQCWVRDCTFDGVYQPRLDNRPFIGAGNVGKILQIAGVPPKSTLKNVRATASRICSMTFTQIQSEFSDQSSKTQKNLCFSITYIYTMLTHGLGFTVSDINDPTQSLSQIEFSSFIDNTKVDWALGAIIYQANQQPPPTIETYLSKTSKLDTNAVKPSFDDSFKQKKVKSNGGKSMRSALPEANAVSELL